MATVNTSPAISSMPTLTAPTSSPPWAQVLPPSSARHVTEADAQQVNSKLEQVYQQKQMREELEQWRQRAQTLESTVQLKDKELKEVEESRDSLRSQLSDLERLYHEAEQHHARKDQELQRKDHELQQAREDIERSNRNCLKAEHDKHVVEMLKEKMMCQVKELQGSEQALQEKVRHAHGLKASMETQLAEREQQMATRLNASENAARSLEGEKRVLEAENEKVRNQHLSSEQETRELRCRNAVLEDEVRGMQEEGRRVLQEKQKAEQDAQDARQDSSQWYQKFMEASKEKAEANKERAEANKEKALLQRNHQELLSEIWRLDKQLHQDKLVTNLSTGELLKMTKANQSEVHADNVRLTQAIITRDSDLGLCMRKIQEQGAMTKEMQHARACMRANAGA